MHRAAVFRVLVELAPYYLEPGDPTRAARLEQVAGLLAPYPRETIAALAGLGQAESGFARYVGEGCFVIPRGAPDCDRHRALGYWQLHYAACPAGWQLPPWTYESLREQVRCAARQWVSAFRRCEGRGTFGDVAGAFGAYGAKGCDWLPGVKRAEQSLVILSELNRFASYRPKDSTLPVMWTHPEMAD